MIWVGVESGDSLDRGKVVTFCNYSIRCDGDPKGSFFVGVATLWNSCIELEVSTIGRSSNVREGDRGRSAEVWRRSKNEILDRSIKFRASMASTRDTIGSADVGESSLIDLEYNSVRIGDSKSIVVESDVCDFIDNAVSQSNWWWLPVITDITSTTITIWIYSLCVKINDGWVVSWCIFENGKGYSTCITRITISWYIWNLESNVTSSWNCAQAIEGDIVVTCWSLLRSIRSGSPTHIVAFYIRSSWDISSVHETRIVGCDHIAYSRWAPSISGKLNPKEMYMSCII